MDVRIGPRKLSTQLTYQRYTEQATFDSHTPSAPRKVLHRSDHPACLLAEVIVRVVDSIKGTIHRVESLTLSRTSNLGG